MIKRGLCVLLLIFYSTIVANDIAVLKSDHAHFNEKNRQFTAKGNVILTYRDTSITTEELHIDVDNNFAWSHFPTTIKKEENIFNSSSFSINLNSEKITLTQIDITITPPENKGALYIKAKKLIDMPEFKLGELGKITTCDLTNPHHFIFARKYKYIPNKKLIMYNVWFYNKLLFIPLYFWFPVYHYQLGDRKIIWNFPVIGKKQNSSWDWYMQNTIDYKYENNTQSSIYIDLFNPNNKELLSRRNVFSINDRYFGYGIHHYYNYKQMTGSLYFYHLNFKNSAIDPLTTYSNKNIIWENTYSLSPYFAIETNYNYTDIKERINSSGSQNTRSGRVALNYDKLGDFLSVDFKYNKDNLQSRNDQHFLLNRKFNNNQRYSINYSELQFSELQKKKQILLVNTNTLFPLSFNWKNELNINRVINDSPRYNDYFIYKDPLIDNRFIWKSTLHNKIIDNTDNNYFLDTLNLAITFDYFNDMDSYLDDIQDNNYLYKYHETSIKSYKSFTNLLLDSTFSFNQETIIANYKETFFHTNANKQKSFPDNSTNLIVPNTYIFKQSLSQKTTQLPFKGTLSTTLDYDQYIFKIPNYSINNGDQMYLLKYNLSNKMIWLPFVETLTEFNSQFIDNDNNSPYKSITTPDSEKREILETLTFYYEKSPSPHFPYYFRFNWAHQTGYNWIHETEKWYDYQSRLKFDVTRKFDISLSSGIRNFNLKNVIENFNFRRLSHSFNTGLPHDATDYNKYLPAILESNIKYTFLTLKHYLTYNINKKKSATERFETNQERIQSSIVTLSSEFGPQEYGFEIQATWSYSNDNNSYNWRDVTIYHHQLQEIKILKHEHKRKLIISYNNLNESWTIRYEFNAFPNDPFQIRKDTDGWRMEGLFNQKAMERFE